jgi:anaerobic selenocysteine-containing dehydrogenase
MKTDIHLWSYLGWFFLEREMFQTKLLVKHKTQVLSSVTFFSKILPSMGYMEKYGTARQATADNMTHAHCMLYT